MLMLAAGISWYPAEVRCALRRLGPVLIGACFVLSSVAARAENTVETRSAPPGSAVKPKSNSAPVTAAEGESQAGAPADTPAQVQAAAEAAYQRAQLEYAKQDLKGALDSMRESYRLCQRPELLYNLALLERELHECSLALADYTGYLQRVPQGRYREAAEQASAELSRECPAAPAAGAAPAPQPIAPPSLTKVESAPPPEPPAPAAPANTPYWTPAHVIGWSALGAGVLAGAGALYFRVAAGAARADAQRSADAARVIEDYDPRFQERQHRDTTIAQVLAVSGGALIAGGALVLIFGSKDAAHARATAQIQAQPGWLGASFYQRF